MDIQSSPQYRPSVDGLPLNTGADFQAPNNFYLGVYNHIISNTAVFFASPENGGIGGGLYCNSLGTAK